MDPSQTIEPVCKSADTEFLDVPGIQDILVVMLKSSRSHIYIIWVAVVIVRMKDDSSLRSLPL